MSFRPTVSALLAAALSCMILIAGCTTAGDSVTADVERVRVSGSGTGLPLLRVLTSAYPGTDVEFVYLPGLHSGGGIRGVANGDLEIGVVSRFLTDEEKGLGLEYRQLSDDGLAVAVHPSVTVDELSSDDVKKIYAGTYVSWADLGGEDLPIIVLDRSEDESAKITLRQHIIGDTEVADSAVNLFYESDMVSGLEGSPGAIGYFSLGLGISEELPVSYVALDGVSPTVAHINDGSYTAVRPLGIVYDDALSPAVLDFIEWMQGDEAIGIMESRGFARTQNADPVPTSGE